METHATHATDTRIADELTRQTRRRAAPADELTQAADVITHGGNRDRLRRCHDNATGGNTGTLGEMDHENGEY